MSPEPVKNGPEAASSQSENLSEFSGSRSAMPPPLQLQASAGSNQGIVQRVDLLTPAQVTTARAFFSSRATQYTAAIINEIQRNLGIAETGTVNNATVQAIATFQQTNGLTVNGTLDTYTAPKIFPHGLANASSQAAFATSFRGIDWSTLTTPAAKAQALIDAINPQLRAAGVPALGVTLAGGLGTASGHFDFATWSMTLDQTLFAQATIPQAQLDQMANYVIHESRHAEQWFNMAQLRAGQGRTAAQIARQLGIPQRIATAAAAAPIAANSSKAIVATNWYESVYGAGAAHRNTTVTNVVASATPANYAAYRALPEESDAFQVGDGFNQQLAEQRRP